MFGIGTWEVLCILILALMFYGPEQLPEIARKVAYVFKHFKKMTHEVKTVLQKEFAQIEREVQLKEMKQQIEEMRSSSTQVLDDVKNEIDSIKHDVEQVSSEKKDAGKKGKI
ncbi:MAG TPA: twin-arginine translocase TatA/TatE family subunit [Oligoflexia bacterium]|nr:twin-arginine translocase TatA/TatE family subunit [Oligoflexia bacterium]HMR24359.1 twin-arginine translocase TatA/TatE family subunit [Oligoflexia bacterium]